MKFLQSMPFLQLTLGMLSMLATAWICKLQLPVSEIYLAGAWCIGLLLWARGYYLLIKSAHSLSHWHFGVALLLGLCIPPFLSHDFFIYLLQGKLAWQGILTYTNGALNAQHPWVHYVDPIWQDCPNHYGPLPMALFMLASAAQTITGGICILKLQFLLFSIGAYALIPRITRILGVDAQGARIALFLNPIYLLQGLGQLHLDLVSFLCILGFVYALCCRNLWLAGISIALLGLTKTLLFPLFLGFWVLYVFNQYFYKGFMLQRGIIPILLAFAIVTIGYLPVWEGKETITNPLSYHQHKEPVKSVIELASYIGVYYAPPQVSSAVPDKLVAQKWMVGQKITPFVQAFALLLACFLAWRTVRSAEFQDFLIGLGLLSALVLTLYSPVMHPWYFLFILPFLGFYAQRQDILIYLTITFALANTYELGGALPVGAIGRTIIIAGTIISVLSYGLICLRAKKEIEA